MQRKSYSHEIKIIFTKHREDWKTLSWISDALKIPFDTIKRWSTKLAQGNDLEDQREWNGSKKLFSDEDLVEYIETHENATLKEIGVNFSVSDVAILKRLRTLKYSYKKKRWGTKKEMSRKEKSSQKK